MQDYLGDFLPVIGAAALVTLLTTPLFRRLSFKVGAVAGARRAPGAHPAHRAARRRRHPRRLPRRHVRRLAVGQPSRRCSSPAPCRSAWCSRALVIFAVGQVDDLREVSPPAKLAGTVLAGSVLSIAGVSILFFRIPFAGLVSLSPDMSALLTVRVGDRHDDRHQLHRRPRRPGRRHRRHRGGRAAPLLRAARTASAPSAPTTPARSSRRPCSARASASCRTTSTPPRSSWATPARCCSGCSWPPPRSPSAATPTRRSPGQTFFFFAPLFIPLVILGVPIIDTAFSILRRARRGANVTVADKDHLHHRLMRLGHGQRRSVLILWTWTAAAVGHRAVPDLPDGGGRALGAAWRSQPPLWCCTPCSARGCDPAARPTEDRFARHRTLGFARPAPRGSRLRTVSQARKNNGVRSLRQA